MKIRPFQEILKRFYFNKRYKFYLLFIFSVIAGLFEYMGLILIFQFVLFLSNPNTIYSKKIIQFFENNLNIIEIPKITLFLGISIACIYILKNIYMFIFTKFNHNVLEDLSIDMTTKTVKNLLYQDYVTINSIKSEDKLNTIQKITIIVWQYCLKYIHLTMNCIIVGILVLYLFIKFTIPAIIAMIFISILSLIEYKYLKLCSDYQNKYFSKTFDSINSSLLKIINSTKEIKLNNKEEYFIEDIKNNCHKFANLNKDRCYNNVFHIYFTEISIMLAFIVVLFALFLTTNFDNQLLITSISTICVIILRLTPSINRAQSCLYLINSNEKTALEIIEFDKQFDENITIDNTENSLKFSEKIELKNIYFKYPNQTKGLNNINIEIKKGDFIGIVGKSGCYKTTLSLIIAGLIKPQQGNIFIDGNILKKENFKKWQNNISLLSQDFSILEEIKTDIDQSILEKLSLNSSLIDKNLSQGQKQRLALANILEKNKPILILDEATSAIDVLSEEKINQLLNELKGKKTIISIAHRFQILKHCTKIIYMQDGEIIDIDTFKNLNDKYDDFKTMIELSNFNI